MLCSVKHFMRTYIFLVAGSAVLLIVSDPKKETNRATFQSKSQKNGTATNFTSYKENRRGIPLDAAPKVKLIFENHRRKKVMLDSEVELKWMLSRVTPLLSIFAESYDEEAYDDSEQNGNRARRDSSFARLMDKPTAENVSKRKDRYDSSRYYPSCYRCYNTRNEIWPFLSLGLLAFFLFYFVVVLASTTPATITTTTTSTSTTSTTTPTTTTTTAAPTTISASPLIKGVQDKFSAALAGQNGNSLTQDSGPFVFHFHFSPVLLRDEGGFKSWYTPVDAYSHNGSTLITATTEMPTASPIVTAEPNSEKLTVLTTTIKQEELTSRTTDAAIIKATFANTLPETTTVKSTTLAEILPLQTTLLPMTTTPLYLSIKTQETNQTRVNTTVVHGKQPSQNSAVIFQVPDVMPLYPQMMPFNVISPLQGLTQTFPFVKPAPPPVQPTILKRPPLLLSNALSPYNAINKFGMNSNDTVAVVLNRPIHQLPFQHNPVFQQIINTQLKAAENSKTPTTEVTTTKTPPIQIIIKEVTQKASEINTAKKKSTKKPIAPQTISNLSNLANDKSYYDYITDLIKRVGRSFAYKNLYNRFWYEKSRSMSSKIDYDVVDVQTWLSLISDVWNSYKKNPSAGEECTKRALCRMNRLAAGSYDFTAKVVALSSLPLTSLLHHRQNGGFLGYLFAAIDGSNKNDCYRLYRWVDAQCYSTGSIIT